MAEEQNKCCHEHHHHDGECCGHSHHHDGECCGHEHEHDQAHEHHHEHEKHCFSLAQARLEFEAYSHDEANVVSGRIVPTEGASIPFSQVVDFLESATKDVKAKHGLVGHFKASAQDGELSAHVSITQSSVHPTCGGTLECVTFPEGVVEFALIAVGVSLESLSSLAQESAARIFV